ncbi:predicted protein [Histoplasma mississippiense (nom. inval.)]|nr:predicted protein [Histoplasma mississippiense (nom. inval.)]EDN09427.1 predicted protein [Histoplasma mississippiense (nom. inval.)]
MDSSMGIVDDGDDDDVVMTPRSSSHKACRA